MKRVKDLLSDLTDLNLDGVICYVSSPCFGGEFEVERISLKDIEGYIDFGLEIITNAGSFVVAPDCFIEKKPEYSLYKWGYRIIGSDIDNNPIESSSIEFGKKYTDAQLLELEEKEWLKEELARLLSEDE